MGAILSPVRKAFRTLAGLTLLNRGKIRDLYALPDEQYLLFVASDGISVFDVVLNAMIPNKGYVLNLMSHFWFMFLENRGVKTHFVAAGAAIDAYLPESLRGDSDLQARAMVVRNVKPEEYEYVYRDELTGSGLTEYLEKGSVCGHLLPDGLQDGDKLPYPIFTPTTKEESGHDTAVSAAVVREKYPEESKRGHSIFRHAVAYAKQRGVVIADTKFEFGRHADGTIYLIDEVLSPDSSRFWLQNEWLEAQAKTERKSPSSYDKQPVRDAAKKLGIHKLDNQSETDLQKAWDWELPTELISATTARYRYIFWRLTGMTIEQYAEKLGVSLPRPRRNVAIVVGSDSDLTDEVKRVIKAESGKISVVNVSVVSCHRNTPDLAEIAANRSPTIDLDDVDVFIAGAGWAAQLPGMLDAMLFHNGRRIPVVGLAFGTEGTKEFDAARLSIECLPSNPVIINELTGQAYANAGGLSEIFRRLATGELPPAKPRKEKPAQFNVPI
ncbi:MAG: phosphoribosylaminoimidazolesuccinocarboxamide synthase [Patescibacteria group bacterium]